MYVYLFKKLVSQMRLLKTMKIETKQIKDFIIKRKHEYVVYI